MLSCVRSCVRLCVCQLHKPDGSLNQQPHLPRPSNTTKLLSWPRQCRYTGWRYVPVLICSVLQRLTTEPAAARAASSLTNHHLHCSSECDQDGDAPSSQRESKAKKKTKGSKRQRQHKQQHHWLFLPGRVVTEMEWSGVQHLATTLDTWLTKKRVRHRKKRKKKGRGGEMRMRSDNASVGGRRSSQRRWEKTSDPWCSRTMQCICSVPDLLCTQPVLTAPYLPFPPFQSAAPAARAARGAGRCSRGRRSAAGPLLPPHRPHPDTQQQGHRHRQGRMQGSKRCQQRRQRR